MDDAVATTTVVLRYTTPGSIPVEVDAGSVSTRRAEGFDAHVDAMIGLLRSVADELETDSRAERQP